MKPDEMIGRRFGRLVVLTLSPVRSSDGACRYDCRCDCGSKATVIGTTLRKARNSSCGCFVREHIAARNKRHGRAGSKEHRAWRHIKGRCFNPTDAAFDYYGGRGITMCEEWADNFEAFLAHIGPAPGPDMTVERIDNDRGYEPGNVRWATMLDQKQNMRRTIRVVIDGRERSLMSACAIRNADYERARRLIRKGVSPVEAVESARATPCN